MLARYDKVDLVPFGEFLPFRELLGQLGLGKLTRGSIDFMPGPGRVTLRLAGLPPASPLICYEAAFPDSATAGGDRPAWLVNITNDAWFGRSSGPYQHLAMARMRAVEEGLPLVRAANTGISVVTDASGPDPRPARPEPQWHHRHRAAWRPARRLVRAPPCAVGASGLARRPWHFLASW